MTHGTILFRRLPHRSPRPVPGIPPPAGLPPPGRRGGDPAIARGAAGVPWHGMGIGKRVPLGWGGQICKFSTLSPDAWCDGGVGDAGPRGVCNSFARRMRHPEHARQARGTPRRDPVFLTGQVGLRDSHSLRLGSRPYLSCPEPFAGELGRGHAPQFPLLASPPIVGEPRALPAAEPSTTCAGPHTTGGATLVPGDRSDPFFPLVGNLAFVPPCGVQVSR